ncbi:MAG: polysaccharide biosynthesis/export family protein [Lysobacteraceae bacterium]
MTLRINPLAIPLILLLLALAGCGASTSGGVKSGHAKAVVATDELGMPDTTTDYGAYTGASEYRIGAQDLLEISVFQVEDLNKTVRVNSGGQISLPLIGTVIAGGKTAQELEVEISGKLADAYLQDPQVGVFVKEFTSQRVTMEGAVRSPGIFPLRGRTSLLQAIALAGGVSDLANLEGIVIFRTIDGQRMAAVYDLRQIRGGDAPDPEVYGDDIVVVDQSGPRTTIRRIIESMPVFNMFRPY